MDNLEAFKRFSPKEKIIGISTNAIIYTRVSTKDQAENTSLESQLKYCRQYAQNNGLEVIKEFGGTYESAKTDDRKEFNRMLKYVKQSGSIGYIIVYSFDRFSRTGYSASDIANKLLTFGVQLVAVTQEVDAKTPSGKFQRDLFFLFSQFDNELRRDKTITAMRELLKKGYWLWTPPRGYTNTKKYHKAVDWNIVVNQEGQAFKKAFKWKADNAYSNVEIIDKLSHLGVKINEKRLGELFRNPFYCGILTTRMLPGEVVLGKHEPLVSQSDFLKINSAKPSGLKILKYDNEILSLKRFTRCGNCNEPLTGFLVKSKGLYYYKCKTKGCIGTKSAIKFNEMFAEEISKYQIEPKYAEIMKEVMAYVYDEQTKEIRNIEASIKKQLSLLNNKIEAVEERFATGEIDAKIYEKFREKFAKEKEQLKEKIQDSSLSSSNLNKAIERAVEMSSNLSEIWVSGDVSQKKKIQNLVFPEGITYHKQNDKVQTTKVNSVFSSIPLFIRAQKKIKNGESIKIDKISALVTSAGFKPATS